MTGDYLVELRRRRDKVSMQIQELKVELKHLSEIIQREAVAQAHAGRSVRLTKKNVRFLQYIGLIERMLWAEIAEQRTEGLKTREIFERLARDHGELIRDHGELKYSNLRSYIHRMKRAGVIFQGGHGMPWRLTEKTKEPEGM